MERTPREPFGCTLLWYAGLCASGVLTIVVVFWIVKTLWALV